MAIKYQMYKKMEDQILEYCRYITKLSQENHTPATSGNFSIRDKEDSNLFWMSASGVDKGTLTPREFIPLSLSSPPSSSHKTPSAEMPLHRALYSLVEEARFIFHSHHPVFSIWAETFSKKNIGTFYGYELIKAFSFVYKNQTQDQKGPTHEQEARVLLLENTQEMLELEEYLKTKLNLEEINTQCFILRKHGATFWASSLPEMKRHVEALFSLCVMELGIRHEKYLSF